MRNHFLPRLADRLNENSAEPVRLFCDELLDEGEEWAPALQDVLRKSKLLLAVWSADYFRSSWCMAEWESFRERERKLALPVGAPKSLVYPIRYADGEHYHSAAKALQNTRDFSALNYPDEVFRQSVKWLEFDDLVTAVAKDLIAKLPLVPAWQGDFPIAQPAPLPDVVMLRPTL